MLYVVDLKCLQSQENKCHEVHSFYPQLHLSLSLDLCISFLTFTVIAYELDIGMLLDYVGFKMINSASPFCELIFVFFFYS